MLIAHQNIAGDTMGKTQSITSKQVGASRRMLNSLAGRHYADESIDTLLIGLTRSEGVIVVDTLMHLLHLRSTLNSDSMMATLAPLLNDAGVSVFMHSAPPK